MNTDPLPQVEVQDFDKIVHFLMFGGLAGVIFFENTHYFRKAISIKNILGGVFFAILLSGIIELIQEYFTASRTGDWMDFLYDGIGAFIAFLICLLINRKL